MKQADGSPFATLDDQMEEVIKKFDPTKGMVACWLKKDCDRFNQAYREKMCRD